MKVRTEGELMLMSNANRCARQRLVSRKRRQLLPITTDYHRALQSVQYSASTSTIFETNTGKEIDRPLRSGEIARIGGYPAPAEDPPPGSTIMWRGLSRFTDMHLGFELSTSPYG